MASSSPSDSGPPMLQTARGTTDLARSYGTHWTKSNVSTLFEWLAIASYKIKCLELMIERNRIVIQRSTVLSLILSTLSGTISVGKFGMLSESTSTLVSLGLNISFTILSFLVAILTGYIKIAQLQEHLETELKLKQDWIVFSTAIASELQLPLELRRDALWIIIKYKNVYLDLLKTDLNIPGAVHASATAELPHPDSLRLNVSTLPHIILDIGMQELEDLQAEDLRRSAAAADRAAADRADRYSSIVKSLTAKQSAGSAAAAAAAAAPVAAAAPPLPPTPPQNMFGSAEQTPEQSKKPSPTHVTLEMPVGA
jgi:hypothetical protein